MSEEDGVFKTNEETKREEELSKRINMGFDEMEKKIKKEAYANLLGGVLYTTLGSYTTFVAATQLSGIDVLAVGALGVLTGFTGLVGGLVRGGYTLYALRKKQKLREKFLAEMKDHPYLKALRSELFKEKDPKSTEDNNTPSV